jgi:ubiquinone biosynthesis accessory factor UbiJ
MSSGSAPAFVVDALLAALNHVLAQHADTALPKLKPHTGALILIQTQVGQSLWDAPVRVGEDGYLKRDPGAKTEGTADQAAQTPRLKIAVPVSLDHISTWSNQGFAGLMRQVRIEGDVDLASTIGHLIKEVRWDPEEDLSRVLGDSLAYRIGQTVRSFQGQAKHWGEQTRSQLGQKLSASADSPLVSKTELTQWQAQLRQLRDAIDRLEQRVGFLKTK